MKWIDHCSRCWCADAINVVRSNLYCRFFLLIAVHVWVLDRMSLVLLNRAEVNKKAIVTIEQPAPDDWRLDDHTGTKDQSLDTLHSTIENSQIVFCSMLLHYKYTLYF